MPASAQIRCFVWLDKYFYSNMLNRHVDSNKYNLYECVLDFD